MQKSKKLQRTDGCVQHPAVSSAAFCIESLRISVLKSLVAMLTVKKPKDISHSELVQKLAGVEGLKHIEEL